MLYVDSHGAGSPQGNCLDLRRVKFAKGDDFKQIVQLPARIEYAVSGIDCYSINISNAVVKSKRFGCELFILQLGVDKGVRCPMKKALRCRRTFEKKVILDGLVLYATNGV